MLLEFIYLLLFGKNIHVLCTHSSYELSKSTIPLTIATRNVDCAADVQKYVTIIDKATNDLDEVLYEAKEIGTELVKQVPVIGPYLGIAFQRGWSKTSDERFCIKELRDVVVMKFEQLSKNTANLVNQLSMDIKKARYMDNVQIKVRTLRQFYTMATRNDTDVSEFNDFKTKCKFDPGIQEVAYSFKGILKDSCEQTSLLQLMEIDNVIDDLFECVVEFSSDRKTNDSMNNLKTDIKHKFYSLQPLQAQKLKTNLCSQFRTNSNEVSLTTAEMLIEVRDKLEESGIKNSNCLIGTTMADNHYSDEAAKKIMRIVLNDGVQIMHLTMACGNATYPNSSTQFNAFTEPIFKEVKETLDFLGLYVYKKHVDAVRKGIEIAKSFRDGWDKSNPVAYLFGKELEKTLSSVIANPLDVVVFRQDTTTICLCKLPFCQLLNDHKSVFAVAVLQPPTKSSSEYGIVYNEYKKVRKLIKDTFDFNLSITKNLEAIEKLYPVGENPFLTTMFLNRACMDDYSLVPRSYYSTFRTYARPVRADKIDDNKKCRMTFEMRW